MVKGRCININPLTGAQGTAVQHVVIFQEQLKSEGVIENKLMVTKGESGGRRINGYIPLYIKEISSKVHLYSTGSYIQYLVKTYNGKESEIVYIYYI